MKWKKAEEFQVPEHLYDLFIRSSKNLKDPNIRRDLSELLTKHSKE
jgi:hypothetical protein